MTPDIHQLLRRYEGVHVEAKSAAGGLPQSLWETYSAFANTEGGFVLFGVSDDGKRLLPTGLPNAQAMAQQILSMAKDPLVVSRCLITAEDLTIHLINGQTILCLYVPMASRESRPVYIGTDPNSGTYIRVGESDFRLSPDEIPYYFTLKKR